LSAWSWFFFFGVPDSTFPPELESGDSYIAQSPTLSNYPKVEYDTEEIWNEVERIVKECEGKKFTIGQNLYYQIPFFCNPRILYRPEFAKYLSQYQMITDFNIPIADSIDKVDAKTWRMMQIIKTELTACHNHKMEKDRGNK